MHDPIQLGYKNTSKRLNKDIYHREMQYQIRIKKSNTRIHENTKVNQIKKKKRIDPDQICPSCNSYEHEHVR